MKTHELFWRRGIGSYIEQDAVDWAMEELSNRSPTPNLAALAGAVPPYNAFEVEDLLTAALREIGHVEPAPSDSFRDFVCTITQRILNHEISAREGCRLLSEAHGGDVSRGEIQAFWLLDMAVRENEAEGFQYYDQRYDGHNFEDLVRLEAGRLSVNLRRRQQDGV